MRDVLALHCSLASGGAWRALAAAMPDVRLDAPDLPGHGRAPDWDRTRDYTAQSAALAAAHLPEHPIDVVGHSFGGCVGLHLLALHPGRLRSLTLVEPVMFAAADPGVLDAHWAEMTRYDAATARDDAEGATRAFHAVWGDGRPFDAAPDAARAYMTHRIGLVAAARPGIVDDVHGVLRALPAGAPPVLIVTRAAPPPVMASIAEGLRARMPQAAIVHAGRGHMIPMEAPEDLARLVTAFWEEAAGKG